MPTGAAAGDNGIKQRRDENAFVPGVAACGYHLLGRVGRSVGVLSLYVCGKNIEKNGFIHCKLEKAGI